MAIARNRHLSDRSFELVSPWVQVGGGIVGVSSAVRTHGGWAMLASVAEYLDVPADVVDQLRTICMALPDAHEQPAWAGSRWLVRKRTFAHVLTVDGANGPVTIVTFRSSGQELDALRDMGHPFFRPGWGSDVVGMVLDPDTEYDEVAELLTESYCVMAPKKLIALVARPSD